MLCSVVIKHAVIFCGEPHQFTEILIINIDKDTTIIHGTLDKLLLNVTAVSDFKKTLRRKQTMQ